jgi:hypothetical protein
MEKATGTPNRKKKIRIMKPNMPTTTGKVTYSVSFLSDLSMSSITAREPSRQQILIVAMKGAMYIFKMTDTSPHISMARFPVVQNIVAKITKVNMPLIIWALSRARSGSRSTNICTLICPFTIMVYDKAKPITKADKKEVSSTAPCIGLPITRSPTFETATSIIITRQTHASRSNHSLSR